MRPYERYLWPLLRRLDPERSHSLTLAALGLLQKLPLSRAMVERLLAVQDDRLAFTWRGLTFRNPVGLAAGMDKDGRLPHLFPSLGFGFIEVGTVTSRPQPGNPKPRVFRIPGQRALVNSLGFPSAGAASVAERLRRRRPPGVPLGVNIGKNTETPLDAAARDYLACLEALYPYADYFVVNVSSPNTEGLTSLQAKPALRTLTGTLLERRRALAGGEGEGLKPLLLKISPGLSWAELDDVVEVSLENGVDGIVAVNTSPDPTLKGPAAHLPGGISGEPLHQRALDVVGYLRRRVPKDFFIVGVGGVFDERDAWALLRTGADAVQLYTGLVYRGPGAVGSINQGLLSLLEQAALPSIEAARSSAPGARDPV